MCFDFLYKHNFLENNIRKRRVFRRGNGMSQECGDCHSPGQQLHLIKKESLSNFHYFKVFRFYNFIEHCYDERTAQEMRGVFLVLLAVGVPLFSLNSLLCFPYPWSFDFRHFRRTKVKFGGIATWIPRQPLLRSRISHSLPDIRLNLSVVTIDPIVKHRTLHTPNAGDCKRSKDQRPGCNVFPWKPMF